MHSIEGFKLAQLSHHNTRTRSSGSENCTVDRSRTRRARLLSSEMGHLMSDGIEWPVGARPRVFEDSWQVRRALIFRKLHVLYTLLVQIIQRFDRSGMIMI